MPSVAPPLSFASSFWSHDYRTGLEVLYTKLEQGVEENEQVIDFLHHRATTTKDFALSQINRTASSSKKPTGFDRDEGAGLQFTFRGLEAQAKAQGKAHLQLARSLAELVELPFAKWTDEHRSRLADSRRVVLDSWVGAWEAQREDVRKLKVLRGEKARSAEVAEADARFSAPGGQVPSPDAASSTSSGASDGAQAGLRRSMTLSERITNNIKRQFGETAPPAVPEKEPSTGASSPSPPTSADLEQPTSTGGAPEKPSLAVKTAFSATPTAAAAGPPTFLLAGLALPAWKAAELIDNARETLALRTIHLPILGEYEGCFAGYELIGYLQKNVEGFGGDSEMAAEAARALVESFGVVRRVVAVGKGSWGRDEEYYQFTGKPLHAQAEPMSPAAAVGPAAGASLLARSGSILSATFSSAAGASGSSQQTVALHVRARREADHIEGVYRTAVRKLDRTRTRMEEIVQEGLVVLQRWEADRLSAVRTVLKEYQRLQAALPGALQPSFETSDLLLDAYSPASDLDALIQRYRTGTFRPLVDVYEPFADAKVDTVFGGDVFRWAEGIDWKLPGEKEHEAEDGALLHPVVRALLNRLKTGYADLPDDEERRKTWVYEVPLQATHSVRDALVSLPNGAADVPAAVLQRRDLPVIAATLRLWLLELGVPLGPDYDDVKAVYPSIGAGDKEAQAQRVEELKSLLGRIPKVRLIILDGIISHLRSLVDETSSTEPDETYLSKLGYSLGRAIIRPDLDTSLSIGDRAPAACVADMIRHHSDVFPGVIAARRAEVDKPKPARRNTRPIDLRPSRSMLTDDERANVQAQLIAGGANSPGLPGMPPSPGRRTVSLNENSARHESDEQIRERVESSRRVSLTKLRIQKEQDAELPAGFMVQPPTPVVDNGPQPAFQNAQDSAFTPPDESAEASSVSPAAPPATQDKPFSPPDDDDDRPPTFTPPKDEDDDRPPVFAPVKDDANDGATPAHSTSATDQPFSPPAEGGPTESVTPRKSSVEQRKPSSLSVGGPRGPRVGGPRGARGVTPSSGSAPTGGA